MINDDKWIYKEDEKGIPTVAMVGFDLLKLAGIAGGSPRTGHPELAGAWEGPGPPADPISDPLDLSQEGRYIEDAITGNSALVSLVCLGFRLWRRFCCGIGMNLAKKIPRAANFFLHLEEWTFLSRLSASKWR